MALFCGDLLVASDMVELNSNVVSLQIFWGGSRYTQDNVERIYLEAKTTHALNPTYGAIEPKCLQYDDVENIPTSPHLK